MQQVLPHDYPPSRLLTEPAVELFQGRFSPQGIVAGLWLHHDDLDQAHRVAQDLHTIEGAFWHGIMHRREPDPGNAGYWFRRVGRHPVFPALRDAVAQLLSEHPASRFHLKAEWDPYAWIDFWEEARRQPGTAKHRLSLEIQRVEWEILFHYCARPIE